MSEKFPYKVCLNEVGTTRERIFERLDPNAPSIPPLYSEGEEDKHSRFVEGRTYKLSPDTINDAIQEEAAEEQAEALQAEAKAARKAGRKRGGKAKE